MSESISQTMCDMGTQTECPSVTTLVSMVDDSTQREMPTTVYSPTTCNAECRFPLVCEAGLADRTCESLDQALLMNIRHRDQILTLLVIMFCLLTMKLFD